jgi:hypothetical protein
MMCGNPFPIFAARGVPTLQLLRAPRQGPSQYIFSARTKTLKLLARNCTRFVRGRVVGPNPDNAIFHLSYPVFYPDNAILRYLLHHLQFSPHLPLPPIFLPIFTYFHLPVHISPSLYPYLSTQHLSSSSLHIPSSLDPISLPAELVSPRLVTCNKLESYASCGCFFSSKVTDCCASYPLRTFTTTQAPSHQMQRALHRQVRRWSRATGVGGEAVRPTR